MKKVLIVFPILHHESLVLGQCKSLNENGVSCDAVLISPDKLKIYSTSRSIHNQICRFYVFLFNLLIHVRGFYRFGIGKRIEDCLFHRIVKDYETIELAGVYSENRLGFASYAQSIGKRILVRVWGTDFYGINNYDSDWRKDLFHIADKIVLATEKMRNDFISKYPEVAEKVIVQRYGLSQLEQLKEIIDKKVDKDISFLSVEARDRIVLTIGYTGRTWQQHFYVLDALEKLSPEQKESLFVLIPMTYDSIPDYKLYIYKRMQAIGIPFQVLHNRLSLIQNLSMRIISDIAVCVQYSDALAASIQEHIMAGSVFVGGDWLPYGELQERGIYMRRTSKDDLAGVIGDIIDNIDEEKSKCQGNTSILYAFSSWKSISKDYVKVYS